MGPLRRNPQSIRAKEIKLDSKAVSVKLMMSQNPEDLLNDRAPDLTSCKLGAKYLIFFLLSFPQNERKISFTLLVLLSLYIFWGKCVYFSIFER